jgi:uncharacterized protein
MKAMQLAGLNSLFKWMARMFRDRQLRAEIGYRRPFLTARWTHLFLATYEVPECILTNRLPAGLEIDSRYGHAFVSLVAFDFHDTRVLGVPWPGYRDFPEVNLRFYVRHGNDRGVVFIRELVPLRLVAWIARRFYNEPYAVMPMTSSVVEKDNCITVEHRLTGRDQVHTIRATGAKPSVEPAVGSVAHFFKEHHWGFGRTRNGNTLRCEVRHPVWDIFPIRDHQIDVDWSKLYGPDWAFLNGAAPLSTVLAAGSSVEVQTGVPCSAARVH